MTTPRGRHRKLRRNILHTVIATALLAGTFTVVDQTADIRLANAAETTGQAGQLVFTTSTAENRIPFALAVGSNGNYYAIHDAGMVVFSKDGARLRTFNPSFSHAKAVTAGTVGSGKTKVIFYGADQTHSTRGIAIVGEEATSGNSGVFSFNNLQDAMVFAPNSDMLFSADSDSNLRRFAVGDRVANGVASSSTALGGRANELKRQVVGGVEYILAAGAFGLKRYLASTGAEDLTFTKYSAGALTAVAVDPVDNSILVGNSTNVYRLSANGASSLGTALISSNRNVPSIVVDSDRNFYVGANKGILKFNSVGQPDDIFNANSNTGTDFPAADLVLGLDNRIGAAVLSNVVNAPIFFRLYQSESASPSVPTLSNFIASDRQVSVTAAKSGTVPTSSIKIYAVEDPTKFCTVSATVPASGNTNLSVAQSCAVTGLTNGTAYTFKAIAYNANEPSAETAASQSVAPIDNAGPVFQSAAVDSTGLKLTMTYSEALNSNTAPTSAFTVKNGSATIAVSSILVNGSTLELTLATPIGAGLSASVAYAAPTAVNNASNFATQDLVGNDAVALSTTNIPVGNNQSTVDQTAPTVTSVTTNTAGTELTMNFNEALFESNPPLASQFTINNTGGYSTTVTGVSVSGTTVVLTLSSPLGSGTGKTVTYSPSGNTAGTGNTAIQDTTGNDSPTISASAITNSSTVDQTAPTVTSATTSSAGDTLTITFNETLSSNTASPSAFTISNPGTPAYPVTVTGVTRDSDPTKLVLALSGPVGAGRAITVSYLSPTADNSSSSNAAVQDAAGNDAASITNRSVTNISSVDQTSPTSTAMTNATNGQTLTIAFSEALSSSNPPDISQFSITTNGYPTSIQSLTVSGSSVVLTLTTPIGLGRTASVTYTAPAAVNDASNLAIQDAAGNDVATFTRSLSPNSSTVDQTAPTFSRSDVNASGSAVILTFNEALNASTADPSNFVVTADGNPVTISSVTISGSTVVLNTATILEKNDIVRISYTAPAVDNTSSNSAIQDTAGNDAGSIALGVVTANGSGTDTKAPVLSATVPTIGSTGLTMTLTFNEALSATTAPASAFSVLVDGVSVVPSSVTISGTTAVLNFSPAIPQGRTVTVAYTSPGSNNATTDLALQDAAGNNTQTFAAQNVTNNSTVDKTPPLLSTVTLPTLGTNGTALTLTYNENLATAVAAAGNFTVTVGGTPVTVSSVTRPTTTTIQLNLATAVEGGNALTVAYTAPASSDLTTNNAIQDAAGNDAASFTAQPVRNNSAQGRPVITSIVVGTGGNAVTINYNKGGTVHPSFAGFTWLVNGEPTVLTWGGSSTTSDTFAMYSPISPVLNVGDVITATYVEPNTGSTTLKSITDFAVTNNSTVPRDVIAPVFSSAAVNWSGTVLTLNYGEALGANLPTADAFDVMVDGVEFTVSSLSASGSAVTLNLGSSIQAGKTVTVSYTPPASSTSKLNAAIQDAAGNDSVALTNQAVTNSSTAGPDIVPPTLASVAGSGNTVTMTFNETLASASPNIDTFTVFVGNSLATVTGVTMVGNKAVLTLSSSVPSGEVVTVAYTAPTANNASTTNAAIQDIAGNDAASFNTTTAPPRGVWTWDTPYDAATMSTNGCDGAGSTNRTKSTYLPNGVAYHVGVTGPHLCINEVTESLSERGGRAGMFVATGLVTEPGLKLTTSNWNCAADAICANRGVMTISFDDPTTNPIISFAGWGGGSGSSVAWSEMKLLTPGVTVTQLVGSVATNLTITEGGTRVAPLVKNPSISCSSTSGYGATAAAGCGSLQINGTVTSVSFQVDLGTARGSGHIDAWNLTANLPEDFGLVPVSYDQPAASHVVGSLKLGQIVTADQAASLYATTNADAVPAGTPITDGSDDGVPESAWNLLTLDSIGQTFTIPVSVAGVAESAYLCAWIDFNRDGSFAPSERSCAPTLVANQTTANISWTVPANLQSGLIYTRVRLSYDTLPLPTGKVGSGEVEDYSLVVGPPPMTANPDTTSGLMGQQQTSTLVSNDVASSGASVVTSSVRICNVSATPAEVSPNCTATTVVVAGVGTYTVNSSGVMTFTPLANYVGTPPALPYKVVDSAGSASASTYTPTVIGKPTTSPDAITTNWDTNQTYTPRTNDTAAAGTTFVANSTKICVNGTAAASCTGTTLTVDGQGTYTVNADGTVTFDPLPTFTGTATPIQYSITDSRGQLATNTITPTINPPAAPSATPDTITTNWDVSQTYTPLSNDTANASFPLLANSVKLCASNETPNNCTQTTLTVAGEGTYTVNPDGSVSFDPLPTFTGTATPIKYQAKDSLNRFVDSTISPIIGAPPAPSASPDAQSTGYDVTQNYTPTSNDTANTNFPLNLTTVKLCQPATTNPPVSAQVPPNCTLTSLTTADGVYTVNPTTGAVEFNPAATFSGTVATPIKYQVKDSINRTVDSTITPTIGAPPGPTAVADTSSGNYDTNQTIDPLANDPDNPAIPLLPATLKLCGINPVETPNNCTQTSLFVPGQGSYVLDPATGLVTFDPLPTFSGTATPIKYQAANDSGQFVNSTITVTVGAPPMPTAKPDSSSSAMKVVQTVNPLGNDTAGVSPIPLDPKSVKLCGIDPVETPNDCTKTTLAVPGKGTFTVDPVTGLVSFTPIDTFHGTVPPINYTVADSLGREVTSQINIVVLPPPAMAAITDTSSGDYNTPQTITPLTNDSAGDLSAPELSAYTKKGSVEKDPTSVRFCGPDNAATPNVDESVSPNCVATSVTTPAGTYVVDTTTGVVTFTPVATFTGTDPNAPTYQTCNNVTGTWEPGTPPDTCASALIIPTVGAPPAPVANPNISSNAYDTNQLINPITNDTANANFPFDPTSVKLCGASEVAPACTKTTLTVLNEGTYTVNPITGVVTFDPLPTFTGVATPISYKVTDSLGRSVSSTITATVGEPPLPTATNDTNSGPFDTDQVISPLTNDSPIAAFPFDQTTVKLCASGVSPPNCVSNQVTTADGVYTVNPNGTVTFNPDPDFTGIVTQPVTYQVTETKTNGRVASATITPTVGAPPVPVAVPDAQTQPYDTNQTYTPTTNDTSNQYFTVSATSVKLCGADDPATAGTNESIPPNCVATSLTTTDGVYTVDPATGIVTFNPDADFTGTTTVPVTYQATDSLNRVINSTITPTVGPPPVATAVPDAQTQPYDTNQTYTPTSNDTFNANFPITATSVKLCLAGVNPPNCAATEVTTDDGVYTVDPATGNVTFNPDPDFTGVATVPVKYQATDSINRVINSTITPTVGPPPVATAVPDAQTQPYDTNQTYTPTSNDTSNANFPITATSVKLCASDQTPPACDKLSVTTADGVYTVDPATGNVTFNPDPDFTGTATVPVKYQATDSINRVINSTITPTVGPPPLPTPTPDTSSAGWDVTQTKNVLTNDVPGSSSYPLIASTVRLCGPDNPNTITLDESVAPNCNAVTVTIPNEGTYSVNSDGTISFDPLPTYEGVATAVTYQASDSLARTLSTTYTPTVTPPPPPTVVADTTSGPMNTPQSIDVLTNTAGTSDSAAQGLTLNSLSVVLSCPTTPAAPACVVNGDGSVTVTGQGTYSSGGSSYVTFTPVNNFTGTAKPVVYTVEDSVGQSASTTYTPTIIPPPTVRPDTTTAGWDVTQSMNVLTSATVPGTFNASLNTGDSAGTGASLVAGSIRLCAASDTAPNCTVTSSGSVEIANQGTYTLDPATGIVSFDPLPTFSGTATPVTYSVTDDRGQKSSTTYTPTVTAPPVPTATPDMVELLPGQSKVFSSIFDGQTGDADPALATKGTGAPDLTNATVCLLTPGTTTCDADGIVTIPGEGTYTLNPTTGIVTYAALSTATPGAKTPVTYKITDGLGRSVTSTLTPTITPPPVANPDFSTGVQGAIQTLSPVGNDRPGGGASTELFPDTRAQIPSGVFLCAANQPPPDCAASTVTVTDPVTNATLGVLTVAASGLVTFTPEPNFVGTTRQLVTRFQIT
jgi:uncharacterized repeat protein (TIGR02059 family)